MTLIDLVRDGGVIGAGGAGFPTHAKLNTKAEFIIMNAAECEPLLRVDQQLMALKPDEILKGFAIAAKAVEANKALIGIKAKHGSVVKILEDRISALKLEDCVEVKTLSDTYPMGDEQVLVYELTGRIVPEAGIPIQVGCVVVNSETCLNIYGASEGRPVVNKFITVTGEVPEPITVSVPVGVKIRDVIALAGLNDLEGYSVIDGGPMMGPLVEDLDGYITKKTKGFVVLKKEHRLIEKKSTKEVKMMRINRATCEQCRMCTDLCPRYLIGHEIEPHKTMRIINYGVDDIEGKKKAQLCCQCNVCELFACPVDLYPKSANNYFRDMTLKANLKYKPAEGKEYRARDSREYRLIPSKRLIMRLGLKKYDLPAPMSEKTVEPESVKISLMQNVGAPCEPAVAVENRVEKGDLIGRIPEGSLGATLHASISGRVVGVENGYITIRRD